MLNRTFTEQYSQNSPVLQDETVFGTITHDAKRAFLITFASTGHLRNTAKVTGTGTQLHYYWMRTDPAYADAFREAKRMAGEYLVDCAVERATHAERPSDLLLIFLIKGILPEYRKTNDRENSESISDLLKAVLLEMSARQQVKDVTPEADWAPLAAPQEPARILPPPPAPEER